MCKGFDHLHCISQAWRPTPVIIALRRRREEDQKVKVLLYYIASESIEDAGDPVLKKVT